MTKLFLTFTVFITYWLDSLSEPTTHFYPKYQHLAQISVSLVSVSVREPKQTFSPSWVLAAHVECLIWRADLEELASIQELVANLWCYSMVLCPYLSVISRFMLFLYCRDCFAKGNTFAKEKNIYVSKILWKLELLFKSLCRDTNFVIVSLVQLLCEGWKLLFCFWW